MKNEAWKPEQDPEELELLEAKARETLGDEAVDSRIKQAAHEIVQVIGWGDMPAGYDPDKDPLHRKRKEVAKEITLKAIAATLGIAVVGGAVVYARKHMSKEDEPEAADDEDEPKEDASDKDEGSSDSS